jgi:low affinity Fe/Cu permease
MPIRSKHNPSAGKPAGKTANKDNAKPNWFDRVAKRSAELVGAPWAFLIAALITIGWAVTGPIFGFSNAWQLVINSITNIATFLVVFLIQNSQNRDARALHLKLDELIRAIVTAHDEMIDIENLSNDQLKTLEQHYERIRDEAERRRQENKAA